MTKTIAVMLVAVLMACAQGDDPECGIVAMAVDTASLRAKDEADGPHPTAPSQEPAPGQITTGLLVCDNAVQARCQIEPLTEGFRWNEYYCQ